MMSDFSRTMTGVNALGRAVADNVKRLKRGEPLQNLAANLVMS